MKVTLRPKSKFTLPIDASCVTPHEFAGKDLDEIVELKLFMGSAMSRLGDLFEIEGEFSESQEDVEIDLGGDTPMVRRVGEKMSDGLIKGSGDIGMRAGAFMSGGKVVFDGDAGPWAGQQMSGGELQINGNAGNYLGSTYRGDWIGMKGGKIMVKGNVGNEVGEWMNGGFIEIGGSAGLHLGAHMKGGVIVVHGDVEDRVGSQMVGGKIVVMGEVKSLLPGFKFEEKIKDIELDDGKFEGEFLRFSGDRAENGEGNLYVSKEKNEHLLST
ncbi:hypothetical protein AKJ45_02970 [candidate division MSBL1 archaeon SCGC-AAA261F19]|uniref:formylmethanofuran dehydrogenase n=1 Tax=candidate division MSBL1 archaeon SCGC-AAA261F19 TaxID=1698275 RepID=A0A133V940_9EURY|nr:hypothetical protein AKJ45_02970 [candidate division MSBL1 archaeon SCGC-AAA261F19]